MTNSSLSRLNSILFVASSVFTMAFLFPKLSDYVQKLSSHLSNKLDLEEIIDDSYKSSFVSDQHSVKERRKFAKSFGHYRIVQICVSDIESVRHSIQGGANSIELCSDRLQGGITPSLGFVRQAVKLCQGSGIEVNVLIRPRSGYFTYTHDEFDIILRDIIAFEKAGVTGIVVGILTKNGHIDVNKMKIIKQVTKDMKVTFHRAFDICTQSLSDSIYDLLSIPCDCLLTSGKQHSAFAGQSELHEIVKLSQGKMDIIAAAGINHDNVYDIILSSQVYCVHTGSSVTSKMKDSYTTLPIAPGSNGNSSSNGNNADNTSSNNADSNVSSRSRSPVSLIERLSESDNSIGVETSTVSGRLEMSWVDVTSTISHTKETSGHPVKINHFGDWEVVDSSKVGAFVEQAEKAWDELDHELNNNNNSNNNINNLSTGMTIGYYLSIAVLIFFLS